MSGGKTRADELWLAAFALSYSAKPPGLGSTAGMAAVSVWSGNMKRLYYIMEKWDRRGWWEYGVSLRSGWLTDKGKEGLAALLERTKEG